MSLFDHTHPPDSALLFRRDDPHDVRWGERVLTAREDYTRARVVLIGCPQDEGVRRNKGRAGAGGAPDAIRRCFYKTVALEGVALFDAGNTHFTDGMSLEDMHARHQAVVGQILADGKTVIVLGGGNDISYPDCAALARVTGAPPLAFNIDAHFDVRADSPRNSGTPYRQLLEEGHTRADRFFEIGYQPFANAMSYRRYLAGKGVQTVALGAVREAGLAALLRRIVSTNDADAIFWGLDIDVVRAADAPGVSAVNPTGFTGEEFCTVAAIAGADRRTRVFEISEVNPLYDIDERTCRLASAAMWHFLAAMLGR